jgi:Na+/serine symporter
MLVVFFVMPSITHQLYMIMVLSMVFIYLIMGNAIIYWYFRRNLQ